MIRSLMYLTASRPDIMFAICAYARHQVTPKECHLHAVKRIIRYLKGHPKLGLWYPKESPFDLVAYSDSDYGGASQDCKSTTEGCQFLGRILISWQCKKQTIVATSTTEAEYVAAASCFGQVLRNLKLNDEAGISSLPNAELFENLQLMRYNILPNQKFTFQKGQFSYQWKYLIHTIMQCLSPKSTGFNEFSSNIAIALVCLAINRVYNFSKMIFDGMVPQGEGSGTPTEPHHTPTFEASQSSQHELPSPSLPPVPTESLSTVIPSDNPSLRQYTRRTRIAQSSILPPVADEPASPLGDNSQGEACPIDSGFGAYQDRANIAKTSTLPSDSTPRVTSLAADEGTQELEITNLKARVKLLDDREGGCIAQSGDDAPIKGRSLDEGEEEAERVNDDTEEMATVLTSMDAASILTSGGVQVVPTAAEVATATVSIPTGSGVVSTASPTIPIAALIFTTATESTLYTRRKGKETMVESEIPKKKKVQEQIDVQLARELEEEMAIDTQRMNE
nr:putative ribonuclease H-like domain-containing protein [Tanacetum cinerariifolium]